MRDFRGQPIQKRILVAAVTVAVGLVARLAVGGPADDRVQPSFAAAGALNAASQRPPGAFSLKYPANGATNVPVSVTLQWNASKGATSYDVLICGQYNCNISDMTLVKGITKTSYNLTGMFGGWQKYTWAIAARNEFGYTFSDGSFTGGNLSWNFTTGAGINPGVAFTEFKIPTPGSRPVGIAFDSVGTHWVTESATDKIVSISRDGIIREFTTPTRSSGPYAIVWTRGIEGVWFTEVLANKIGRVTPDGNITEYSIPTPYCIPMSIAGTFTGMWFTENASNKIGHITPDGVITEYPTPGIGPTAITASGGGGGLGDAPLWFAQAGSNNIVRFDPTTGIMTQYPIPTPNANPQGIAEGLGYVWFTETQANKIGRLDPTTGVITEYTLPTANANPQGITLGADAFGADAMWFAEYSPNKIGRITPDGKITEYSIPALNSGPTGITGVYFFWERKELWFTEYLTNQIGRVIPL